MKHKQNVLERKIHLRKVNDHIICSLCRGYLVEATTITECLHTFCKSCIVRFLRQKVNCPRCGILIHQSHPLNYISHDRTMQDIVYKLVPSLQENELKRQKEFYKKKGLPLPKNLLAGDEKIQENDSTADDEGDDCHRVDEQVNICLECHSNQMKTLKRRYLRCSSQATVTHLKKFVALKIYNKLERYRDIDLLCNEQILGKDHNLKFICVTLWPVKDIPLQLQYRPKVEF